ncbi:MAG: hypothetical protein ACJA1T_000762 [Zhongshania aliphaticivorans]|jgi:hypothetical protein|uniref:RING-type E3 ubiquitin transferase n=1 Tax=Zhongshania aliphaticivorans TaxID=1470434 RepID=A0A127M374_9GAMM|nr:GIDE domain-containing protein [Zhongshania aliphaticivorans]AMO67661.1 hypothetical protein AZF00_04825 [Zhongshania aliphaticivorans]EIF44893.1 hypothetical protein DOK_01114 [gamma proteobacterium BDW918]
MSADYLSLGISAAIALGCAYGSLSRLHSARIIEDTPTSKIRSAHQGYVELIGFAKAGTSELLLSGLSQTPCLWYRYNIERYESSGKNSHWRSVERKTSEQPFILNDGTGDCIVYPDRAEVSTLRKKVWKGSERHPNSTLSKHSLFGSRYRYTEEILCADDLLYIIGQFQTRHPPSASELQEKAMATILNDWKRDYDQLVARFDRNGDGEIDLQEWDLVRAEALRKAQRQYRNQTPPAPVHTISYSPSRRQPYMIASSEPDSLSKRFRWQAFFLLVASLGSAVAFMWLIAQ